MTASTVVGSALTLPVVARAHLFAPAEASLPEKYARVQSAGLHFGQVEIAPPENIGGGSTRSRRSPSRKIFFLAVHVLVVLGAVLHVIVVDVGEHLAVGM